MSENWKPPFAVVSFYPGIPIRLLDSLNIVIEPQGESEGDIYAKVMENASFYDVFTYSGGRIETNPKKNVLVSYLSSKVIVPVKNFFPGDIKISLRVLKNDVIRYIGYIPFLSIAYLVSPVSYPQQFIIFLMKREA
jgi:CRISPR-associated protein Csc3